ncbi:hypothetical protein QUF72_01010 [Desulfobacterales bacterium HSG2]|nr:hypothetical protein [Desulfobacterales bacterium HSG2]
MLFMNDQNDTSMRYIEKVSIEHIVSNEDIKPLLAYIDTERKPSEASVQPMHPNYKGMKSDNRGESV